MDLTQTNFWTNCRMGFYSPHRAGAYDPPTIFLLQVEGLSAKTSEQAQRSCARPLSSPRRPAGTAGTAGLARAVLRTPRVNMNKRGKAIKH
ncbi:hypothetical protein EVAR_51838_1 [Eumeta japonica]|uniref:Uncharacterized protein n=1 Tax=Eumeta variegata TaxID=151549 RepID=A0A4C1YSH4_EUMVA|nr:hypothetical protein EVAR_51838_1 [Eumeta japonica]